VDPDSDSMESLDSYPDPDSQSGSVFKRAKAQTFAIFDQ
jgi:hypothetical protein